MTFKIGDKVRVVRTASDSTGDQKPLSIGDTGEVIRIGHYRDGLVINWTKTKNTVNPITNSACGWPRELFELVEEKKFAFEVGKKYSSNIGKKELDEKIYSCVYVHSSGQATLEWDENSKVTIFTATPDDFWRWKEVKEKVKNVRYVHWFWSAIDRSQMVCQLSKYSDPERVLGLRKENYIKTDIVECETEVR